MQIPGLLLEGLYLWILPALYMGMIVCMMYLEVITRMHKLHPIFQIRTGNTQPTRIRHRIRWQHWNRRMTELIAMILQEMWKWIINFISCQTYVCMPVQVVNMQIVHRLPFIRLIHLPIIIMEIIHLPQSISIIFLITYMHNILKHWVHTQLM